jgi:hypothetical protein
VCIARSGWGADDGARRQCDIIRSLRVSVAHFPNDSVFVGMYGSSHYHAEADHARRLAEMTIQPNVAQELLRVAEELDRLADDLAVREPELRHPEILKIF